MRRTIILVPALACLVLLAWRVGTGSWPGASTGARAPGRDDASETDEALLRGRRPEALQDAPPPTPRVPDAPPDWAYGTITGRVVGPDGQPLPNSGAAAVGVRSLYGSSSAYRDAPADEDGYFVLHAMAGLASVVVAGAEGHGVVVGPRVLLEEGATRDVGTLQLEPEHRLRVRVVTNEGAPVPDVDISIEPETDPLPEGWEAAWVASSILAARSSDEQGRVVFDMLPPGTWRVLLDTGEYITRDRVREHVEPDGEELVFVLPTAIAPQTIELALKVLGPDGLPVPLVRTELAGADCSAGLWLAASAPDPLELECAVGPVRLIVQEPQAADRTPLGYAPVVIPDVRGLESPLVVRMAQGAAITGRVDWGGDPASWRVHAYGHLDPATGRCTPTEGNADAAVRLSFSAQTQADGSFCILGIPPGRFALGATGPGLLREPGQEVESGATGVVLTMVPEVSLQVHVLPPKGQRFGSAEAQLEAWVEGGIEWRSGWHGGGGDRSDVRMFEAQGLAPDGRYRLRAWGLCSGGATAVAVLEDVVGREAPYVMQLTDAPHVRGVVEREDGTPVWGMQVRYRPWPGGAFEENRLVAGRWLRFSETDQAGAFDLSGIGEQEILVTATGLGLALRDPPQAVLPGSSGIRLVVVPERRISGRITDPSGGVLDGLRVAAVPAQGRPTLWTPHYVAADGFFEVRGLAPGAYRIAVWSERETTDTRTALSVPLDAGQHDARIALRPGPVLEGIVRDAADRVVPGASVHVLGPWTNRATQTDAAGRYVFTGLPRDVELEVEVVPPRGRSMLDTLRITQTAEPTTLDVTLPKR